MIIINSIEDFQKYSYKQESENYKDYWKEVVRVKTDYGYFFEANYPSKEKERITYSFNDEVSICIDAPIEGRISLNINASKVIINSELYCQHHYNEKYPERFDRNSLIYSIKCNDLIVNKNLKINNIECSKIFMNSNVKLKGNGGGIERISILDYFNNNKSEYTIPYNDGWELYSREAEYEEIEKEEIIRDMKNDGYVKYGIHNEIDKDLIFDWGSIKQIYEDDDFFDFNTRGEIKAEEIMGGSIFGIYKINCKKLIGVKEIYCDTVNANEIHGCGSFLFEKINADIINCSRLQGTILDKYDEMISTVNAKEIFCKTIEVGTVEAEKIMCNSLYCYEVIAKTVVANNDLVCSCCVDIEKGYAGRLLEYGDFMENRQCKSLNSLKANGETIKILNGKTFNELENTFKNYPKSRDEIINKYVITDEWSINYIPIDWVWKEENKSSIYFLQDIKKDNHPDTEILMYTCDNSPIRNSIVITRKDIKPTIERIKNANINNKYNQNIHKQKIIEKEM